MNDEQIFATIFILSIVMMGGGVHASDVLPISRDNGWTILVGISGLLLLMSIPFLGIIRLVF